MYDNNEHNPRWATEKSRDKREKEEKREGDEKREERWEDGEEKRGEDGERRGELTRQSHGTHTHGENLYM